MKIIEELSKKIKLTETEKEMFDQIPQMMKKLNKNRSAIPFL